MQVNVVEHFGSWAAAGHALSAKVGYLKRQAQAKAAAAAAGAAEVSPAVAAGPTAAPAVAAVAAADAAASASPAAAAPALRVADLGHFVEAMRYFTIRSYFTCSQVGWRRPAAGVKLHPGRGACVVP